MSPFQLVLKRVRRDWRLLLPAALGVLAAVTLVSAAPMFLASVERLGYVSAVRTAPELILNIVASADFVPAAESGLTRVENGVAATLDRHLDAAYAGHERSLQTDDFLLDPTPIIQTPKPASALAAGQDDERAAYFINAAEFEKHVRVLSGRMPGGDVSSNLLDFAEKGPVAEAVVSASTASNLGIRIGDTFTLFAGLLRDRVRASATVVGIVEPMDEDEVYWQGRAAAFFGSRNQDDGAPGSAAFVITPEAASKLPEQLVEPAGYTYGRAFIATVSGLDDRVSLVKGRAALDAVHDDGSGPVVEAVLPVPRALPFGIQVGSVLTLTPFIDEPVWVRAKIVGIVERAHPDETYWKWGPAGLFDLPEIPDQPLPLLVSRQALVDAVGSVYPDSLMRSTWYAPFDRDELQAWSPDDAGARLRDLKIDLAGTLPGSTSISGLSSLLETVERQRFAASLTLIALAATTTLTLLFFVSLMMNYVVGGRRSDVGKLSALGAARLRILKLYGAEALAVTLVAAVSAPLLAFAAVVAAVMLPLFDPYRGSSPIPVEWVPWSFAGAAAVGALCFCILALPPLFGAGAGQLSRRFRWVRAPSTLLFQKYHVDTFLLVLGGLFYWEIYSRGELVAGGLFRDSNVNEVLFVAPVLLVLLVGLLFVRLFPLALRFAAGESPVAARRGRLCRSRRLCCPGAPRCPRTAPVVGPGAAGHWGCVLDCTSGLQTYPQVRVSGGPGRPCRRVRIRGGPLRRSERPTRAGPWNSRARPRAARLRGPRGLRQGRARVRRHGNPPDGPQSHTPTCCSASCSSLSRVSPPLRPQSGPRWSNATKTWSGMTWAPTSGSRTSAATSISRR